jgi:hypothetical protein
MKWMLLYVVAGLIVKDWYPLSNFAMFANLNVKPHYVFVTDGEDRPIPIGAQFGMSVIRLKKLLVDLEDGMPSVEERGKEVLDHVVARRSPKVASPRDYPVLRLWRVELDLADRKIVRTPTMIAERAQ